MTAIVANSVRNMRFLVKTVPPSLGVLSTVPLALLRVLITLFRFKIVVTFLCPEYSSLSELQHSSKGSFLFLRPPEAASAGRTLQRMRIGSFSWAHTSKDAQERICWSKYVCKAASKLLFTNHFYYLLVFRASVHVKFKQHVYVLNPSLTFNS